MKQPPLLRVEWVDSKLIRNEWQNQGDMQAGGVPIVSVGFRVKEEDGNLYLAASWNGNPDELPFAAPVAIPLRAIVRKCAIGVKKRRVNRNS